MKCSCGNDKFYAHQVIRVDIIVDDKGIFHSNIGTLEDNIYDVENPYGPFQCTECGKVYEELN